MECPSCGYELHQEDVFGRLFPHQDGKVLGIIYKCYNEDCGMYESHFYTYVSDSDNLHEGYPC